MRSYYDILGVKYTCSQAQIKNAFLRKSKELHPDTSKGINCHKKFVELNEAYSILNKAQSRQQYDDILNLERSQTHHSNIKYYNTEINKSEEKIIFEKFGFYNRKQHTEYDTRNNNGFYGFAGIKKQSNARIASICTLFIVVGAIFHFAIFSKSREYFLESMDRKDKKLSALYEQTRNLAESYTYEQQKQRLLEKFEAKSNMYKRTGENSEKND